jgi:hypothetical protein
MQGRTENLVHYQQTSAKISQSEAAVTDKTPYELAIEDRSELHR